jgi:hypothetical protein
LQWIQIRIRQSTRVQSTRLPWPRMKFGNVHPNYLISVSSKLVIWICIFVSVSNINTIYI